MAAIQGHHKPHPKARKYGAYQSDIYKRGMFENVVPTVTTDPNKLEAQAKGAMTSRGYNYVTGGAGERATMDANRPAFRQRKVMKFSRMLDMLPWQDMAQHLPLQVYCVGQ